MMALVLNLIMASDGGAAAFDARMAASYAAAERLQGPLDGTWRLKTARGRLLYVIQISDPPGGGGLHAAWRDPAVTGMAGVGPVETMTRRGAVLLFDIADMFAVLHPDPRGGWRGRMTRAGHARLVRLVRP
jgi:hypothetical protein